MALYTFGSDWEPAPRPLTGGHAARHRRRSRPPRASGRPPGPAAARDLPGAVAESRLRAGHARRLCRPRPRQPGHAAAADRPGAIALGVPVHVLCGNHDQYLIDFVLAEQPEPQRPGGMVRAMAVRPRWPSWASAAPSCSTAIRPISRRGRGPGSALRLLRLLRRLQLLAAGRQLCLRPCRHQSRAALDRARPPRALVAARAVPQRQGLAPRLHRHPRPHHPRPGGAAPSDRRRQRHLPHRRADRALQIEDERLRFVCVTSEPKLKAFKRLPGLDQKRRFELAEAARRSDA